ncbi:MAG: hypothetical protein Q8R36_01255 [bacterium]|nr:hypothetical protein [bacterium]
MTFYVSCIARQERWWAVHGYFERLTEALLMGTTLGREKNILNQEKASYISKRG